MLDNILRRTAMAEIEITGIRKDNGNHENPYEAVEFYRWVQHGTDNSGITRRETVVGWLDRGVSSGGQMIKVDAYVHRVNPKVYCFVNESKNGTRFLQTHPDATEENNLLRLPEC
jgi:hypothetical protein